MARALPLRELWFVAPRRVEIREGRQTSDLRGGELRARALASGVSRGTELLLYRGEGPERFDPSLDAPGAPTYPRRYGYAWIGEVVEVASDVTTHHVGDRVFALVPHGDEHVLLSSRARTIHPRIRPNRAVLAAQLETATNVVWDAGITLGDDVVVLGGGVVGSLVAWLARRSGASKVRVVEPSSRRRDVALRLGASAALAPEEDRPCADADVVIEASGDPAALTTAIAHAAVEARIVVASFYGTRTSAVAFGDAFHRRRLTLRSSQVSTIPPSHATRWDHARRFALVSELLTEDTLDLLCDRPAPFDDAPRVYAELDADPDAHLQILFRYR